jgi:hypothetical protein
VGRGHGGRLAGERVLGRAGAVQGRGDVDAEMREHAGTIFVEQIALHENLSGASSE